jgi:hypothetical protein
MVSVTSAPPGGHAPTTGASGGWPSELAGMNDFTVTGVVSPFGSLPAADGAAPDTTGAERSIFDTGELPAVKNGVSRPLKALTVFAALLVALGIFTLVAHSHFSSWSNTISADSSRWWQDLKVATGISPKQSTKATAAAPGALPPVRMVQDPANAHVTVNVRASSFSVKMVAYKAPSWMQVTDASQQAPIYQQVLAGGANTTFPVTRTLTVETGSASARAYIYEGTTFIGFFFPSKAPYTMTFNAVG